MLMFWTLILTGFLQIYSISIEFSIPGVFAFVNVQNACFLIVLDSLLFLHLTSRRSGEKSIRAKFEVSKLRLRIVKKGNEIRVYLDVGFIENLMRLNFLFGIVLFKVRRIARVHYVWYNRGNQPLFQNIVPVYR